MPEPENGSVTANASAVPTSGQAPVKAKFRAKATGGTRPYKYGWNFGDGSKTSTVQDPSHTYTKAGMYTAALTVTDSANPPKSVTASLTIVVSPIGGTVPGAPQNVTANAGNAKITLNWQAPSSDGGETITAYEVFRGTSSGTETLVTSGRCRHLRAVLTCTDRRLTNGTTYYYYVIAANPIGTGPQSNETSAAPGGSGGGTRCKASAKPANDGNSGDYNVSITSNQPNTNATAEDANSTKSGTTDSVGSVTLLLQNTKAGEAITVTVGTATCTTKA
jgi:PKD repeat protein